MLFMCLTKSELDAVYFWDRYPERKYMQLHNQQIRLQIMNFAIKQVEGTHMWIPNKANNQRR